MFTVDGLEWTLPCDIKESITVHSTDISGELLNGQYFNDVDGTYLSYTLKICPNPHQMGDYYALKSILTQPVDGHAWVFPYMGSTVQITARISSTIDDVWIRNHNGAPCWAGMQFTITANGPTYEQSQAQAIARGLTPLPDVAAPEIGDTYTFTANGWVQVVEETASESAETSGD